MSINDNDNTLTSVLDKEEEDKSRKEILPEMTGMRESSVDQCDEPIIDEQQQSICDIHQFEKDKKAVYNHPLFPLLALLLEKCEMATSTLNCSTNSSTSFNSEITAFLQHQQRDDKPFLSNDPEVDALMFKAIQVLRIHLLELEKVSELCKDFCQRYIACLRTKMNSENLLRGTSCVGGGDMENQANSSSFFDGSSCSSNDSSDDLSLTCPSNSTFPSNSTPQTVYQMVQTAQGLVAQPIKLSSSQQHIHGSTPISQIGNINSTIASNNNNFNTNKLHIINTRNESSNEEDLSDDMNSNHSGSKKKQQKRGVLPKQATSIMRSWLFQHIVHPYPTEDEKRTIASQTNLTLLQVNNWFINARRRILQPMLDTANSLNSESSSSGQNNQSAANKTSNSKKIKTTRNPSLQRFWPESIANAIQGSDKKNLK